MKRLMTKTAYIIAALAVLLPLHGTIKDVVVFTDRALVTREQEYPAVEGIQEALFQNIPLTANLQTIRAKGFSEKGGGLKILDIQVEKNYQSNYSEESEAALQEELTAIDDELKKINTEKSRLKKQKKMLELFLQNAQVQSSDDLSKGSFSIAQWQEAYAFYIKQTEDIDNSLLGFDMTVRKMNERRSKIRSELSGYSRTKSHYTLDVVVSYEMKKEARVRLLLNYITSNAGWYSLYDCRVNLDEEELFLGYYAQVYQNTGESWDNVDLVLSTARPDLSGTLPALSPWILSYYEYTYDQSTKRRSKGEATILADEDGGDFFYEDAKAPELEKTVKEEEVVNIAAVETQGVNLQYRIVKKSTIPSGNKKTKVTVASEIPLKTDFAWEIVPRYDRNAFIKGTVHNNSDFTFLPGEMALFVNDSFIGNSTVGLINTTQEFDLSLGRDPRITSEFKLVSSEQGKKIKKKTEKRAYEIIVYNNANENIPVTVKDILPKSSYPKKIVVKINKIAPEPEKVEDESIYNWNLTVKKGGKIKIIQEWEVEYPEELTIQGL